MEQRIVEPSRVLIHEIEYKSLVRRARDAEIVEQIMMSDEIGEYDKCAAIRAVLGIPRKEE